MQPDMKRKLYSGSEFFIFLLFVETVDAHLFVYYMEIDEALFEFLEHGVVI